MLELHFTNDRTSEFLFASGTKHQIISLKIASSLLHFAQRENLGYVLQAPCDLLLSSNLVIHPDIVFFRTERGGLIGERKIWGAPDVIVEVVSPDSRKQDVETKRNLYSRFEVPEYWIVEPDLEIIEVLAWSEMGYATAGVYRKPDQLSSPTLPGFRLPLRKVFGG